ncbi:MAG TPA: hypothetical protein VGI97_13330 [Gemmatimonadaceae bacterium]|jgi:hypothetical protein
MRSRDDLRRAAEAALRVASLALIVFALWRLVAGARGGGSVIVRSSALAGELPAIESGRRASLHVQVDAPLTPAERDALAALARDGERLSWGGGAIPALAAVAERAREPGGPVRIAVSSTADVALADGLAALDSVRTVSATHGATVNVGEPSGALTASSGAARAPIGVAPPTDLHPVLVVGRAGWEAKFAIAALEEQGWKVDARVFVAPGADVTQGSATAIDTAHFSAIVALDTTLGKVGPSIAGFVRGGGGLVLLADAASAPSVRAIAPARVGARRAALNRTFDVADPLTAMAVYPLEALRADAVQLSTRGAATTSAARREGAGRVLQVGFDETWRWRMQGGSDAVAAHRAWWSRMAGSVAAIPLPRADESSSAEGAPFARLVDALGPATAVVPAASVPRALPAWLLPALLILLLVEWGSRRLRGAK